MVLSGSLLYLYNLSKPLILPGMLLTFGGSAQSLTEWRTPDHIVAWKRRQAHTHEQFEEDRLAEMKQVYTFSELRFWHRRPLQDAFRAGRYSYTMTHRRR